MKTKAAVNRNHGKLKKQQPALPGRLFIGDPDENRPLAAARGTHASVKTLHRSVFFRTLRVLPPFRIPPLFKQ